MQQNLLLRWCPAPGCSYAIKVDFSPLKPMSCSCKCGHEFCFDCGDVWHEPVPCDLLKRFNGHVKEGLFNPVYYASLRNPHFDRIKTCPNPYCKISIQKIFGCHVMVNSVIALNKRKEFLILLLILSNVKTVRLSFAGTV